MELRKYYGLERHVGAKQKSKKSELDSVVDTGNEEEQKRSVESSSNVYRTMGRLGPPDDLFDGSEQTSTVCLGEFVVQRSTHLDEGGAVEAFAIEDLDNGEEMTALTGCDDNGGSASIAYCHGFVLDIDYGAVYLFTTLVGELETILTTQNVVERML